MPQAEIEGDMGAAHVGLQARLMSQALRKLSGTVSKTKSMVIFLNQMREKVGVMYGNPETTPGGKALKFYASVRLDIRKAENIKNGTEVVGSHVRCKVVKNKVAPPFRTAEFDIMYGIGISKASELLDLAVHYEIVEKSGSWFSYQGQRIGQGKDNARKFLEDTPGMMDEIEKLVREKMAASRDDNFEEGDDEPLDLRILGDPDGDGDSDGELADLDGLLEDE